MKIRVYGPGCKKCTSLMENTETALGRMGLQAEVSKSSELSEMMKLGIMKTPALVIDGKVESTGRVLSPEEIEKLLSGLQAT